MRAALLLLVAGCHPNPGAPQDAGPSPNHAETSSDAASDAPDLDAQVHHFDVVVREYGSHAPVPGATIDLIEFAPENTAYQAHRSLTTDRDGIAYVETAMPAWRIERVYAPGYLNECPARTDEARRHHLSADRTHATIAQYVCDLVPRSALIVRTAERALEVAKDEIGPSWREIAQPWHALQPEFDGLHWEISFVYHDPLGPELELDVLLDALDATVDSGTEFCRNCVLRPWYDATD
jgi:hypothetical protein